MSIHLVCAWLSFNSILAIVQSLGLSSLTHHLQIYCIWLIGWNSLYIGFGPQNGTLHNTLRKMSYNKMKNYESFKKTNEFNNYSIQITTKAEDLLVIMLDNSVRGLMYVKFNQIGKNFTKSPLNWTENGYDSWDSLSFFENHDFQM